MNWKNWFKSYDETYLDSHPKAKQIDDLLQDPHQWEKGIEYKTNRTIIKHKEYDIWFYYYDSFNIYNSEKLKVLFIPSCLINRWEKLFLKIKKHIFCENMEKLYLKNSTCECVEAPLEKRLK